MANRTAILAIRIISDTKQAAKGFKETQTGLDKFQNAFKKLVAPATVALGAVTGFAKSSIDAAKKLELAGAAAKHFWADQSAHIVSASQTASTRMGLTAAEYKKASLQIGGALRNAGVPLDEAAKKTDWLIQKAADLGVQLGGDTKRALYAIQTGLRGNSAALGAFNVDISRSAINAELAARGLDHLEGEALRAAEAQIKLSLIARDGADHYGMFAVELKTAAMQQKVATVEWENARAELGTKLLPYVTKFYQLLRQGVGWVSDNSDQVFTWGKRIAIASGAILVLNGGLNAYRKIAKTVAALKKTQAAWSQALAFATYGEAAATGKKTAMDKAAIGVIKAKTAAQKVLNIVMKSNPIKLVILAVIALIAAIVLIIKNWDKVKAALIAGAQAVKDFFVKAWELIKTTALAVWKAITDNVKARIETIIAIGRAVKETFQWIWEVIKFLAAAAWKFISEHFADEIAVITRIARTLRDFIIGVWKRISAVAQTVWTAISNWITARIDDIRAVGGAVRDFFISVWERISAVAQTVWTAITNWVTARIDDIRAVGGAVRDFFISVWERISAVAQTQFDRVRHIADRALAPVRAMIDGIRSAFDAVVGAVQTFVSWLDRINFPKPPAWIQNLLPGGRGLPSPEITLSRTRGVIEHYNSAPSFTPQNFTPIYTQPSNTINITVNGLIGDELALGRELERVLNKYARHTGARTQGQTVFSR